MTGKSKLGLFSWKDLNLADDAIIIQNEFGGVAISKNVDANGERLRVVGLTSGVDVFLDALELERIAEAGHDAIALLVSPEGLETARTATESEGQRSDDR